MREEGLNNFILRGGIGVVVGSNDFEGETEERTRSLKVIERAAGVVELLVRLRSHSPVVQGLNCTITLLSRFVDYDLQAVLESLE